jgi:hypothetical protein
MHPDSLLYYVIALVYFIPLIIVWLVYRYTDLHLDSHSLRFIPNSVPSNSYKVLHTLCPVLNLLELICIVIGAVVELCTNRNLVNRVGDFMFNRNKPKKSNVVETKYGTNKDV